MAYIRTISKEPLGYKSLYRIIITIITCEINIYFVTYSLLKNRMPVATAPHHFVSRKRIAGQGSYCKVVLGSSQ